jgi:hypothetical protein
MCECLKENHNKLILGTKKHTVRFEITESIVITNEALRFSFVHYSDDNVERLFDFQFCPWCGTKI